MAIDRRGPLNELENISLIDAALVTAWDKESVSEYDWRPVVSALLRRNVRYIVCVGEFSEALHDLVDETIYELQEAAASASDEAVMTTFHDEDSVDDALFFYQHLTVSEPGPTSHRVALLDMGKEQDRLIGDLLSASE